MNTGQNSFNLLRHQYENFPYPPIPFFALPGKKQGEAFRLATHPQRILIIGCGTFEPLVVARAHPDAREIACVDLSARSIQILQRRIRFSKIARPFSRIPKFRTFVGDFMSIELRDSEFFKNFDFVLASNVLHHSEDPATFLAKAASALKIGGVLRVVTYPASSRIWMRATSRWLKEHSVLESANIKKAALESVRKLPITNPVRACYESHQERDTKTGIIDAFFNACENPLAPLQWKSASSALGLKLVAETQDKNSSSQLVDHFLEQTRRPKTSLDVWEKLQIMDDSWELCSNLILWFEKTAEQSKEIPEIRPSFAPSAEQEMAEQFSRADQLLRKAGSSLEEWVSWLKKEVGPRVWPNAPDEILRGLSITEYAVTEILASKMKRS